MAEQFEKTEPVKCPGCGCGVQVSLRHVMAAQESMTMTLQLRDGRMITAVELGTAIRATGRIINALGREHCPGLETFVESIDYQPDRVAVNFITSQPAPKDPPHAH